MSTPSAPDSDRHAASSGPAPVGRPRDPHLARWLDWAETLTARVVRLRRELSAEQLSWRPRPGAWNVVEIAEHLRRTGDQYYPRLRRMVARQAEAKRTPQLEYRRTRFGGWFLSYIDPASRKKLRAPGIFRPESSFSDPQRIDRFVEQQVILYALLRDADGLDLVRGRFFAPIPVLRFTLGEGLELMVVHQERHVQQMEALTMEKAFPRG